MGFIADKILKLTKGLYPTGRAFRIPFDSTIKKIHKGLAVTEEAAYNYAVGVLNGILPDNTNFTVDDAERWERRLGIASGAGTTLEDRKSAIIRKMNYPGSLPAKGHWLYVQGELQAAGFDVYVHENRFQLPDLFVIGESSDDLYYKPLGTEDDGIIASWSEVDSAIQIQYYDEKLFVLDNDSLLANNVIRSFDLEFNLLDENIFPALDVDRFYIYEDTYYIFRNGEIYAYDYVTLLSEPSKDLETSVVTSCDNLHIYNGYAYIADLFSNLVRIFDLSTTLQINTLSISNVNCVRATKNYIYTGDYTGKLQRTDLDGTNTTLIDTTPSSPPRSISEYNGDIYVGYLGNNGINIYDKDGVFKENITTSFAGNTSPLTTSDKKIGYNTKTPEEILNTINYLQHGTDVQHGTSVQHGVSNFQLKVVNYLEDDLDAVFTVGDTQVFTFFVGGQTLGDYVNVPVARKNEFRELLLKLKPAHTVAYTFINYV